MNWVVNCKYIEDYTLELTFNDGCIKRIDLSSVVSRGGIFKKLQSVEYFKTVEIDETGTTICWDNGADICPDTLYGM